LNCAELIAKILKFGSEIALAIANRSSNSLAVSASIIKGILICFVSKNSTDEIKKKKKLKFYKSFYFVYFLH